MNTAWRPWVQRSSASDTPLGVIARRDPGNDATTLTIMSLCNMDRNAHVSVAEQYVDADPSPKKKSRWLKVDRLYLLKQVQSLPARKCMCHLQ